MNAEININNVILETERLILRAWEITDLDNFFEYASVNGVGEKAGWEHHKCSKRKSKSYWFYWYRRTIHKVYFQ